VAWAPLADGGGTHGNGTILGDENPGAASWESEGAGWSLPEDAQDDAFTGGAGPDASQQAGESAGWGVGDWGVTDSNSGGLDMPELSQ